MDRIFETTLMVPLTAKTSISLQQQLYTQLRDIVLEGKTPTGTRMPSSRALAQHLGISRNTVLAVYDQLVAEGYFTSKTGAGTFVNAEIPDTFNTAAPLSEPTVSKNGTGPAVHNHGAVWPGMPAFDAFPRDLWARLISRVWRKADEAVYTHNDPLGYAPLRKAISIYLGASRGVVAQPDQVIIVSGLIQGFRLITDCLLSAHAPVYLENPGYSGFQKASQNIRQPVDYIPLDGQGALPPSNTLSGLLVTCPSRQYPLGITMPLARRLELLNWASKSNSLILEDDYDSEFRYAGKPLGSMQGLDGGQRVIYGGSFSKSVFPALRLGYLVMPEGLVKKLALHRSTVDSFPSILPQIALASFINEGHFARHIRRLRKVHAHRKQLFQASFVKHLSRHFTLNPTDTGLHLVVYPKRNRDFNGSKLAEKARLCGIGAVNLSSTYTDGPVKEGLLIGFANLEDRHIDHALKAFSSYIIE
ncbi:MocR-like pyridoxine biosynthesis transcription factor PdxR [Kordiimonas pumila]|uniref:PLP-dependent aminotransferase family protein n=1 Tax=Kordiimonas pumila TaxID=2161677 RepID=A0ABV7D167_9PROT|nr:PLP-dependent aminotransferase family protein [Kordiimonas pumila]